MDIPFLMEKIMSLILLKQCSSRESLQETEKYGSPLKDHEANYFNGSVIDPDLGFFCNSHIIEKQAVHDKK